MASVVVFMLYRAIIELKRKSRRKGSDHTVPQALEATEVVHQSMETFFETCGCSGGKMGL